MPGWDFKLVIRPVHGRAVPRLPARVLLSRRGDVQRHRGVHGGVLLPRARRLPDPVRVWRRLAKGVLFGSTHLSFVVFSSGQPVSQR